MSKKKSIKDLINDFKNVHSDRYDYSLVEYKNNKTKVKIICNKHGVFEQIPSDHLNGSGCKKCSILNKPQCTTSMSFDYFLKKANKVHDNRFDYIKCNIKNNKTKMCIICKEHGKFYQSIVNHLNGSGCSKCKYEKVSKIMKLNKTWKLEDFIKKANEVHNNKYDYKESEYFGSRNLIKIKCPFHGFFKQRANDHIQGSGCPVCKQSKGENKIEYWLNENNVEYIKQKRFSKCKDKKVLPFDFYLPEYNICVEYNGEQHYIPVSIFGGKIKFEDRLKKDKIKLNFCNKNNINLLIISYKNFDKIFNILKKTLEI